jgi:hypothetical protein
VDPLKKLGWVVLAEAVAIGLHLLNRGHFVGTVSILVAGLLAIAVAALSWRVPNKSEPVWAALSAGLNLFLVVNSGLGALIYRDLSQLFLLFVLVFGLNLIQDAATLVVMGKRGQL